MAKATSWQLMALSILLRQRLPILYVRDSPNPSDWNTMKAFLGFSGRYDSYKGRIDCPIFVIAGEGPSLRVL